MFILARGRVGVFDDSASGTGARDHLATLQAPNLIGEMGLLTGQARGATVVAENEVLCYRLDKATSTRFCRRARSWSSNCLASLPRRQMANDAKLQGLSAEMRQRNASNRAADLVRRIKSFFAL